MSITSIKVTWTARLFAKLLLFVSRRNVRWSLMVFNRAAIRWPRFFYRVVQN
jgi:hypothetical protein